MLVYKWAEDVILVKGYNRSCLYDLTRKSYDFVPNDFNTFIRKIEGKERKEINFILNKEELEWFKFCDEKEYFLLVPDNLFSSFEKISMKWESPSYINNAVVYNNNYLRESIGLVDSLLCRNIVIFCETDVEIKKILSEYFTEGNFQSVDFFVENCKNNIINYIKKENPIVGHIYTINNYTNNSTNLDSLSNSIISKNSKTFHIDINVFIESQEHNTYFNRKLLINNKGEVQNCSNDNIVFGHVNDINIETDIFPIVSSQAFQRYWKIHKDKIDVCMHCEFRHMCINNETPFERKDNTWYQKKECNYNPFISKWVGEDGYKHLDECGVRINDDGFKIDKNKLEVLNKELW